MLLFSGIDVINFAQIDFNYNRSRCAGAPYGSNSFSSCCFCQNAFRTFCECATVGKTQFPMPLASRIPINNKSFHAVNRKERM